MWDLDRIKAVVIAGRSPWSVFCRKPGCAYRTARGQGTKAAIYGFNGNKIITTSGGGVGPEDKALIDAARHLSTQARDAAPLPAHDRWLQLPDEQHWRHRAGPVGNPARAS